MLEVTEKALEAIEEFLKDREGSPAVRVFLQEGGWSGPALAMALDEPLENDMKFTKKEVTFVIDKELLEKVSPVSIDYSTMLGFGRYTINSSLVATASCSGGTCSC